MESNRKVLEPSLKVGSDNQVGVRCSTQPAEDCEVAAPNLQGSAVAEVQQAPAKYLKPKK